MGIKERRDLEKAEMKQKIMDAATDLIAQEGYEKLSIRKIAAKIQYSPTTIYLYYKDKAEIIAGMSDELYHKVTQEAEAAIREDINRPAEEQVHHILCIFIKTLCSEPEMAKAIMHSGLDVVFANEQADGIPANPGIKMLDDLLQDGLVQNVFRPGIAGSSWMITSAMLGFVMTGIENRLYLHDEFDRFVSDFVALIMNGIKQ